MSTAGSPRTRRLRLFVKAIVGAAIARPIVLLCTLAQTPIALHALNPEGFGFWLTLTAILNTLSIADLGLSLGAQNKVSIFLGKNDLESARCIYLLALKALGGIGALLIVLLVPIAFRIDWAAVFHLDANANRDQALACILYSIGFLGLSIPLNAGQKLAAGLQLSWIASTAAALGNVGSLACVALAAAADLPLAWFIGLAMLPLLLSNLVLTAYLFHRHGWSFRSDGSSFDRQEIISLARSGLLFFFPQLGAVLVFALPSVILAFMLGSEAVTPFGLGLRVCAIVSQLFATFLSPLWPAYAEANARHDYRWIKTAYLASTAFTIVGAGIACSALAFWGTDLIHFWIGASEGLPSFLLMGSLAAWTFLTTVGTAHACFLNGLGILRGQATYGFISALVSVALIVPLVHAIGADGVALALLLGYAAINCPGFIVETLFTLRNLPAAKQSAAENPSVSGSSV